MPVYRVIYDVRNAFDGTSFLMMGLFVAIGLALWGAGRADVWLLSRFGAAPAGPGHEGGLLERAAWMRRLGLLCLVAAPLILGSMGWMQWSEHRRLSQALERGGYTVVEGEVAGFERGDRGRHHDERFSVVSGGRRYTYAYRSSRYEPGFHESHGPIRAGMHLRIADVGGSIARVEVRTVEDSAFRTSAITLWELSTQVCSSIPEDPLLITLSEDGNTSEGVLCHTDAPDALY